MTTRFAALMLLSTTLAAAADTTPHMQTLDLSGVTAVRVTGEASSVHLTTIEGEPLEAVLQGRRSGWFANWTSSWFYDDCRTESSMEIDGETLVVDVRASSWLEPSDCRVELKANLQKASAVAIEQAATQAWLAGEFSAFSLDAKAADVTLDGHAVSIALRGDAMRSHLTLDRTDGNETIAVTARSLDTHLDFPAGTPISYDVKATAALVDSTLPNTMGAKPSVVIEGDYVRATIR